MSKQTEITCGIHAVRHTLQCAAIDVLEIWVQRERREIKGIVEISGLAVANQISVQFVSGIALDKITQQAHHQGIAIRRRVTSPVGTMDLDTILAADQSVKKLLFLVLDGVKDPRNLGACLRTADAAGVSAVIIPKDRAVGCNPTVRRVASGAAENTPLIQVTNLASCLKKMQQAGIWIIGTDDQATKTFYEIDMTLPTALVLGAEEGGLRRNTCKHCDDIVTIPMVGIVESLNVAVATGVCLYEAQRQRSHQGG